MKAGQTKHSALRSPVGPVVVAVIVAVVPPVVPSIVTAIIVVTATGAAGTSAAATTTTTIGGPTHVDARGGGVWPLCDGVVHPDTTPIQLHAIGTFLCLFGILTVFKVDKGEAPGASRLLVIDNAHVSQRAVLGEHFSQVPLRSVQAQPKHAQTAAGVRVGLHTQTTTKIKC